MLNMQIVSLNSLYLVGEKCCRKTAEFWSDLIFVFCEVPWELLQCMVPKKRSVVEFLQLHSTEVSYLRSEALTKCDLLEANPSICVFAVPAKCYFQL